MMAAGMEGPADLVDQAVALYALPLDDFTAARNAAAKEAARKGDRELAAELRKLAKPSSAAWLVNVLVRRRGTEVAEVLDLGASLREAQATLDRARLHALGQQRQRLLAAVARQSLVAAAETGLDVGTAALPGVEQTLRAALADPAAASAVLTGRLVRTLEASGWDPVDLTGAVGGPFEVPEGEQEDDEDETDGEDGGADVEPAPSHRRPAGKVSARRRRHAEAQLASAREARSAAGETAAAAERRFGRLAVRRAGLIASIEDLQERLEALHRELADIDHGVGALEQELSATRAALSAAAAAEEQAIEAVAQLDT